MSYQFDLTHFTIGDQLAISTAAKNQDIAAFLHLASRFTSVDIFALHYTELTPFLNQFAAAINETTKHADPVWKIIQQSLEGES